VLAYAVRLALRTSPPRPPAPQRRAADVWQQVWRYI